MRVVRERIHPRLTAAHFSDYRTPVDALLELLDSVELIAVDDRILDTAGVLEPAIMRAHDAIHVASALALGPDLEAVVTDDERMIAAAGLVGLPVVSPA